MKRIFVIILQIIISMTILSSIGISEDEYSFIKKLMDRYLPNDKSVTLTIDKSFTFNPKELPSLYLKTPSSLLVNDNILIADNLLSQLTVSDKKGNIKHEVRGGQGPGEIQYPIKMKNYNGKIAVYNRNGIDIFTKDMDFINRIRIFAGIHDFTFVDDSLAVSVTSQHKDQKNAIVYMYNADGIISHEIYDDRNNYLSKYPAAFIEYIDNQILYFDRISNRILKYTPAGKYIGKESIKYSFIDDIVKWNSEDKISENGSRLNFLPSIRAIKQYEGSIYILLNIPRLEILKIDNNGNVLSQYINSNYFTHMQWTDFDVLRENNRLVFYVIGFERDGENAKSFDFNMYRLDIEEK